MSSVLLKNLLSNWRLQVRIAWGADLTADPATWTWTDVTSDVWQGLNNGINISPMGRSPQTTTAQPAGCTLRLKNPNGQYTPYNPGGANYPNVRLGTPVQVRVSFDGGSTWSIRFQGEAASWAPGWDAQGKFAYVVLTAAGITRRLGSGSKPLRSPLVRAISASSPFAYWPLEDGPRAERVSSYSGSAAVSLVRILATGPAEFGAVQPATGATAMPSFIRGGALQFAVRSTVSSAWTVEFAYFFGTGEPAPDDYSIPVAMNVIQILGSNLDFWELQLSPHNGSFADGRVALFRSDEDEIVFDTLVDNALATYNPWDGATHHVAITASQSGSDIDWQLILDGTVYSSGTLASRTLQAVDTILLNENGFLASSSTYGLGHLAVFESVISVTSHASAAAGWTGETADDRITRLCDEEGISLTMVGTSDTAMGAQSVDTIFNLLRECEAADLGYLLDGLGPGLVYTCLSSLYNQSAQVTVNANSGQVPATPGPLPSHDSQWIRNRVTVTRTFGSFIIAEDVDGNLGTDAVGVFDSRYVVNVDSDNQLPDIGSWLVHLGTVEGLRYTQFPLDFAAAPELAAFWWGATPTNRFDLTNLSSQLTQHPPGTVSVLVEGWSEFLNDKQWRAVINCSPYQPWKVFTIAAASGDTGEFVGHLDTDDSALNAAVTATATSFAVKTNSGPLWTTTSDDFPFDINIDGEQITVTNITGTSSPQTFTVTRSVNGVVKAHLINAAVALNAPLVLAL